MKIYIKKASACYDHPEDMREILAYLAENGTLLCSEETVESQYRDFSEERYCAGWLCVDQEVLEEFANWLADIDI